MPLKLRFNICDMRYVKATMTENEKAGKHCGASICLNADTNANVIVNANVNEKANVNVNANENVDVDVNVNVNMNANANVNANTNANANANANVDVDVNVNANANANVDVNVNANVNVNVNVDVDVNANMNATSGSLHAPRGTFLEAVLLLWARWHHLFSVQANMYVQSLTLSSMAQENANKTKNYQQKMQYK